MIDVTILSRHDCHLCDVVERMAKHVQAEVPFTLTRMNIDEQADLVARYGDRVPVVLIDQVEALSGKMTEGDFRRAIQKAGRKGLLFRILSLFKLK
ncbi:MAG: glutaredoxin family protein [Nitrospiraceae bacterium]|nr:glutaredoxin family protein [Nitrospiraceae bacterium]MSR23748.1 glutaredoxin family protein [Nitrospiraceae bacterium]